VRLVWPGSAGRVHSLGDFMLLRRLASTSDVVHAHGHQAGLLATAAVIAARGIRARRHRAPKLVVSQHNAVLAGSGRSWLKRLSQRWVAGRADLVTGASSDLVSEALAFGASRAELAEVPSPRVPRLLGQQPADGPDRARIRRALLTSLPVDTGGVSETGGTGGFSERVAAADPAAPLIVTVSRIAPQKNLPALVQAAARLPRACTWVVVGGGDPRLLDQLRRQASGLGAPVHFIGPSEEVERWLRAAEVFVLPSAWEARALVVQEAMAAGAPVVASDVGGLHDLVAGAGLLVPPADPGALAAAVERILADPSLRDELAGKGRRVAAGLPDGSDTARRWLAWYSETQPMT